jgi:signal transduction histidine kinase
MSEEYQKHLFQPFSQEEVGYSRPYEGTGLGLALTKKFVELMNGEIKVWSKKGEGTEFEVIFPLTKN